MLGQPIKTTKVLGTAAILQLNCRGSHLISSSLFNDENSANFLFITLQEPPKNTRTNRPAEQSGWHLVTYQPPNTLEESRPRSCIYVNKRPNLAIQPIDCKSRDVLACTIKINTFEMLLVNVYNQPATFKGFEDANLMLKTLPTSILLFPTVLVTDSNLHSPLWNPATYHNQDSTADRLVEVMTQWDLHLCSPKGVLTDDAKPGMASGTTIDLVWLNQQADDMLVACLVD